MTDKIKETEVLRKHIIGENHLSILVSAQLRLAASTKNSLTWTTLLLSQFQLICLLHKASGALLKALRMLLCYLTTSTILSVATTLSSSMNGTFWPAQFLSWMRTTL